MRIKDIVQAFNVGDLVRVKAPKGADKIFLGEPANVIAYVYETYSIGNNHWGVSLITENGKDLGGFDIDDQRDFLVYISTIDFRYKFKNVSILHND